MDATTWNPSLYLTFDDHRARPFRDLLARIPADRPRRVVDMGCGPGHLTHLLALRWPDAAITAFDSSAEMVEAARQRGIDADRIDVVDWTPPADADVVITNAVLQWVPRHWDLLPRWMDALPRGACFAMQVPGNFLSPSHLLLRELAEEPRWSRRFSLRDALAVLEPQEYAALLSQSGAQVDAWETTYLHRLTGDDPVLTWISATALRPVRDALDDDDYQAFTAELAPRLRAAYPSGPDGSTWFPFRRIFAVART